ncbi:MAG TPA: bZIP transcription factor [Candidatus Limnocylindrales bacterium]|nr:bZIP transcription factor [Candidatus Limnocylindrales bacterium]
MKKFAFLSAMVFYCVAASAQQSSPVAPSSTSTTEDTRMKSLEERVNTLTKEVALLRAELQAMREAKSPQTSIGDRILLASTRVEPGMIPAPASSVGNSPTSPEPVPAQASQMQTYGGATSNAKLLNPDISFIGDFIGTSGHNAVSPSRSLEMHESEVGMQAIIDPYARADGFISFGEEGVNIEEGYVTFTALPAGLLLKVGKMRAEFGKVNMTHNHALPFIDRPLATNNLVGGEDGIDDAGISLSRFLPAPKNWFVQGTAQVYRGDSANVFQANSRQDVSVVGHLRVYRDLGESTNIDLGASYARGHNNAGIGTSFDPERFLTNLYAADATLRWKPLRRAIYHSFLFRNEFFWSARDQLSAQTTGFFQTQHAFGLYSDAEYRINRRWTFGGRFDRSGHANNASLTDTGFSSILTYWPSEFSQIRGQYRFGHLADPVTTKYSYANEFLFQFLFVMGAHGAHPF